MASILQGRIRNVTYKSGGAESSWLRRRNDGSAIQSLEVYPPVNGYNKKEFAPARALQILEKTIAMQREGIGSDFALSYRCRFRVAGENIICHNLTGPFDRCTGCVP